MKRIGKLNGKTVVQGDPNLVKQNEILYKQEPEGIILQERKKNNLENITAGGDSDKIEYFKFNAPNATVDDSIFRQIIATAAFENGDVKGILPYSMFGKGYHYNSILGFTFAGFALNNNGEYAEIHSLAEFFLKDMPDGTTINDVYTRLNVSPITKEEYYDLIK